MGRLVKLHWDSHDRATRPASARDHPDDLFDAFIPHPIDGWRFSVSTETADRLAEAESRVAAFNHRHRDHRVASAEWLMRRAESAASSTIEGIRPPARRLARAEERASRWPLGPHQRDAEAVRGVAAFEAAMSLPCDRPVSLDDLLRVHSVLMGDDQRHTGMLRPVQNWLGSGLESIHLRSRFVGPPPEAVPALMGDLLQRIANPIGSPLLEIAVVHAQFETIHPFGDGNGRTGRALMQMMLRRGRLAPAGTLPISAPLALRRSEYIEALQSSHVVCLPDASERGEALSGIIGVVCGAAEDAAVYGAEIIRRVEAIESRWTETAARAGVRRGSAPHRLVGVLSRHPLLTVERAAALLDERPGTARRALQRLESLGMLTQRNAGRVRVFEADAVLDAYADAAQPSGTLSAWGDGRYAPEERDWADTGSGDASPSGTWAQCPHFGERSRRRCRLQQDHAGQHRY